MNIDGHNVEVEAHSTSSSSIDDEPVIQMNIDGQEIDAFTSWSKAAASVYGNRDDEQYIRECCEGKLQVFKNCRWKKTISSMIFNNCPFVGDSNGFGKLFHDEFTYTGRFKDGKMFGLGKCEFKDGCILEVDATWELHDVNYLPTGNCLSFKKSNGDEYVGEMKRGKYHGMGKLTKCDGTIEEGLFVEDEFKRDEVSTNATNASPQVQVQEESRN